eukprot:TRINITY_DN4381_c0_g1_i1.p1 TRINITY_DN4381_c0_g1~~TRINITY_DN4381_c0_g1_i1.p1  ORF type:complete len:342 (+),score=55.97 TRINITY_DN4381_c0_g1_i1:93-1118(+)
MRLQLILAALAVMGACVSADGSRPVVGILALPMDDDLKPHFPGKNHYIPASYVKWLESAGTRVAVVQPTWSDEHISSVLHSLNGVLMTGGSADIYNGRFAEVQRMLLNSSISDNLRAPNSIAFWATCLGFESVMVNSAHDSKGVLTHIPNTVDVSLPLDLSADCNATGDASSDAPCFLFSRVGTPSHVLASLAGSDGHKPSTYNHHSYGVTADAFRHDSGLTSTFRLVSTSTATADASGGAPVPFVSTVEHLRAVSGVPVFATQWHAEKPQFEWSMNEPGLNHDPDSITAMSWVARRFVDAARLSPRVFPNDVAYLDVSIYKATRAFTGDVSNFEEVYVFA